MDGICVKCGPKTSGFLIINEASYIFFKFWNLLCIRMFPFNIYFDVSVISWNPARINLSSSIYTAIMLILIWTELVRALYLYNYPAYLYIYIYIYIYTYIYPPFPIPRPLDGTTWMITKLQD